MRTLVVNALRGLGVKTGPGRHVTFLAQQWSRMDTPFDRIVFMSPRPLVVDGLGTKTAIEFLGVGKRWPRVVWEQVVLPWASREAALLFAPTYTGPLLYPGKLVVANHGIYEALPGEFSWWARLRATPLNRRSSQRADCVIANSLATKQDIVEYFGVPASKIEVVYPAAHDLFFRSYREEEIASEVTKVFGARVPYVIFFGKLARRRNIPNLIKAFSEVRKRQKLPHHLLLIGPNTTNIPITELAAEAGLAGTLKYIPYLELPPLAKLCAGADLYVLPTVYEGISQTMFEAMASGTPVLTVDHPTLAEGGAEAVYSVPTPSVADLTRGLTELLTEPGLLEEYAQKGRSRASRFSWAETARQTMRILDRVAPGTNGRSAQ